MSDLADITQQQALGRRLIMGENTVHDSAPATRPMSVPATAARLADALEAPSSAPYLATGEPTIAEAANLLARIAASGAVARLDLLHDALMTAHRRGRAAEHREVERLADIARRQFGESIRDRALACELEAGRPWWERTQASGS